MLAAWFIIALLNQTTNGQKIMKTKTQAYKEPKTLVEARNVVRSLKFGTNEWEAAMQIVRGLVQVETDADQALLNHRCVFDRD